MSYEEHLASSYAAAGTTFCLGIDPVVEWFPAELRRSGDRRDVSATSELVGVALDALAERGLQPAAVKPNIGFFARYDRPVSTGDPADIFCGSAALAAVIRLVRERLPETPIILDAKRGDIARSSANYAAEAFDAWGVDSVTVSPWMGDDSVEPFLRAAAEAGKGTYILARTSNPGARRFQNLESAGTPMYMKVAETLKEWSRRYSSVGAVVGATAPQELSDILRFFSGRPIPLLIPGVGRQGGDAGEVLATLRERNYPLDLVRINASSGALFPWAGSDGEADWRAAISASVVKLHRELSDSGGAS